jgi:hypothetical protein
MIQENELRIGNLVSPVENPSKRHQFRKVSGIYNGRIYFLMWNSAKPEKCYPIPLTTEILLAAGFELVNKTYIKDDLNFHFNGRLLQLGYDDEYDFREQGEGVQYVHELQNLYYALMRKELVITVPSRTY